ncbi:hypothetical protein [Lichenihabitans psoromatis]|uniref:hypothetical protein n=1 Tax=Lichenihabitans psoromatis TaxID=2528642 RepID=UPI0013F15861|nr:hypothetical protein [Lichenihabitans psoromatis]
MSRVDGMTDRTDSSSLQGELEWDRMATKFEDKSAPDAKSAKKPVAAPATPREPAGDGAPEGDLGFGEFGTSTAKGKTKRRGR